MKIVFVRQTVLPALLVLSPVVFAADEQTMIVSAAPQVVSELDTPAAVSVVDGEEMRLATPRINLSESLTGVPGLQVQNRQNYAQDLQLSIRGFGSRSTYGIRGIRLYVDGIPATMPDGQGQTSNIDLSSVQNVEVLRGPFSALYGNASGGVMNVITQTGQQPPTIEASSYYGSFGSWRYGLKATGATALAATLGADLILLSDVSGILDGKGQRIAEMTAAKAEQLIEQGIITDGMIVKVNAALDAARTLGRPVDIASWRHAEQLPALFNGMPMGTRILA